MTDPGSGSTDDVTGEDRELAARLEEGRPVPAAGFRGALGRTLGAMDPGYGPRPNHLLLLISLAVILGLALIAAAAAIALH